MTMVAVACLGCIASNAAAQNINDPWIPSKDPNDRAKTSTKTWVSGTTGSGGNAVRGDASGLPKIDVTKTFQTGTAPGFERVYEPTSLEMKAAHLPAFSGTFRGVSLDEVKLPQLDRYSKTVDFREVEMKKALDKWSAIMAHDQYAPSKEEPSGLSTRESPLTGREAEKKEARPGVLQEGTEVEPGPVLEGEKLRDIIQHGKEAPPIDVGHGFLKRRLGGESKAPPEKKSPPKSETSK